VQPGLEHFQGGGIYIVAFEQGGVRVKMRTMSCMSSTGREKKKVITRKYFKEMQIY